MPDPYSSLAERRLAVLKALARKGPLTLPQLAVATGSSRHAIERALNDPWFEHLSVGRNALFGLSALGKERAAQSGAA